MALLDRFEKQPDDIDQRRLSLGEHLEELRKHVFRAVLWLVGAFTICLCFQSQLMQFATYPHTHTMKVLKEEYEMHDALEKLPGALVHRVYLLREDMNALDTDSRSLDRNAAIIRTKVDADPDARVRALEERRNELVAAIAKLRTDQDALLDASKIDAKKAAELEERRVALVDKVKAFTSDVQKDVASLSASGDVRAPRVDLIALRYTESVMAYLQVASICALFIASPFIARELWKFVAAGLHKNEKKYIRTFAPLTFIAFIIGCCFGYFILIPAGLKFLATYADDYIVGQFALSDYLSLFLTLTLAVGVMFELPLIMTFLTLIGIGSAEFYRQWRRYWILCAFIIAAVVSPTPDPVNQTICALPLLFLYEAGILASRWVKPPVVAKVSRPPPPVPPPSYAIGLESLTPYRPATPATPAGAAPTPPEVPPPTNNEQGPTTTS